LCLLLPCYHSLMRESVRGSAPRFWKEIERAERGGVLIDIAALAPHFVMGV